jgi:hypothetical protein
MSPSKVAICAGSGFPEGETKLTFDSTTCTLDPSSGHGATATAREASILT